MQLLNIHGPGDMRLDPRETPVAGDADVVVQIHACGICGSDLSYVKWGGINPVNDGVVVPIGHEAAGTILSVGDAVTDIYVGQRVVINPITTPSYIGGGGPEGAFSQAVLVADAALGDNILPIPDDLPFDIAALTEPLAVALHGVNRANVAVGDKVVVFGCGPIGLGMILWLADRGITDVIAVDLSDDRLARASALGASAVINASRENVADRIRGVHGSHAHFGKPVSNTDIYMDAAGGPTILNDVVQMAKWQARLIVTAAYTKPSTLDLMSMLLTEMSITTAMGYPTEMPEVLAHLPRLKDKVAPLISHRFGFDQILAAFETAATPQSAKVMVEFTDQLL